jgi:hypothetical protein
MESIGLIKKIRTFLWYHLGKKDLVFNTSLSKYIPDVVFERDAVITLVAYKKEFDTYTALVSNSNQRHNI